MPSRVLTIMRVTACLLTRVAAMVAQGQFPQKAVPPI